MHHRIVLLHGWGADADDLRPVGDALSKEHPSPLDVICLSGAGGASRSIRSSVVRPLPRPMGPRSSGSGTPSPPSSRACRQLSSSGEDRADGIFPRWRHEPGLWLHASPGGGDLLQRLPASRLATTSEPPSGSASAWNRGSCGSGDGDGVSLGKAAGRSPSTIHVPGRSHDPPSRDAADADIPQQRALRIQTKAYSYSSISSQSSAAISRPSNRVSSPTESTMMRNEGNRKWFSSAY